MPTPFINLHNITDEQVKILKDQLQATYQSRELANYESSIYDFAGYLKEVGEAIVAKLDPNASPIASIKGDFDINAEPARFLKEVWNSQAPVWPLIETLDTYWITTLSLLRKLRIPDDNCLDLLSLGSGPGIYETFLAKYFNSHGHGGRITCLDFAEKMTEVNNYVISLQKPRLMNISTITASMDAIPLKDRSVNAVICNNSLQWCLNWKQAVKEMGRVIIPGPCGCVYLIVHLHDFPMTLRTMDGETPIKIPHIAVPTIMDELEKNMFTIWGSTQMMGGKGSGQAGGELSRVLLVAQLTPQGLRHEWRKARRTPGSAFIFTSNKK